MNINERHIKKIEPLNRMLEQRFGLRFDPSSVDHLIDVRDLYDEKRDALLDRLGEAARECPAYAKAVLLSEAARLLLREIAPKRRKKPKKKRG